MSLDKFIEDKRDSAHHAGRRSNRQRLESAMQQIQDWRKQEVEAHLSGHSVDLPPQVEEGGLVEPFLDAYYRSEQDQPRIIEGQIDTENPRSEYYVGLEGHLVQVPKVIYDSRMDIVKSQINKIRAELASFIKPN